MQYPNANSCTLYAFLNENSGQYMRRRFIGTNVDHALSSTSVLRTRMKIS